MKTQDRNFTARILGAVRNRKIMAVIAAAIIVVLVVTLGNGGAKEQAEETAAPAIQVVKVNVMDVKPVPLNDILTLPGQTEALHDVVLSAERGGRVEWIGPEEGEEIELGQDIVKIDMAAAAAALNKAKASHVLSKKLAARRESLHKSNVLSKEELDQAETDLALASGTLREAQVAYDQGLIKAPFKGVVNKLYVDPGEYVDTGAPVADMVNVDSIRINVNVPEMDVRYLKKGEFADVIVDAYPDEKWAGEIDFVSFKADPATKTFKVRVVVKNDDGRIRPGMLARASFQRRSIPEALIAPLFAVLDKGGERIVFVVEDGVAHARTVSIGVISDEYVQITDGLKVGDKLIITGQTEVEEGTTVTFQ